MSPGQGTIFIRYKILTNFNEHGVKTACLAMHRDRVVVIVFNLVRLVLGNRMSGPTQRERQRMTEDL